MTTIINNFSKLKCLFQIKPVGDPVECQYCVYTSVEKREHGGECLSQTGQFTHGAR